MFCELVRTTAVDGVRLDGMLLPADPAVAARAKLDAIFCLHGVGSNFYGSTLFENLAPVLRSLGLPVAIVNTRGHDTAHAVSTIAGRRWMGAAYEVVDECRLDVSAWLEFFAQRGWRRIGIAGHSLGAIKAVYSQAFAPHPSGAAVIALSPPRLSNVAFRNSFESSVYLESLTAATEQISAGRGDTLIKVKFPFPMLISAAGYMDKYGPGERYNVLQFVDRVACPLFFSYGGLELEQGGIAFAGMPDELRSKRQLQQSLTVAEIAGADHNYTKTHAPLAEQLTSWLLEHFSS